MSHTGHLSELEVLRSQVDDLSRQLAERDRSAQDLREHSAMLRAIVEGTAMETGEEFFAALVRHLTTVLHIKYAVIGEVQGDHIKKIRTLAVSAGGVLVDNFDYELADTPCATALTQSFTCFDRDVQATFPQFQRLTDLGAESYCAVPIRTKGGAAVGLLVVMDTKPLEHRDFLPSLLEVFAPRIAAEFERMRAEQERAQALADLHNVIETIPDIVFALDRQGNVVKWNRRLGDVTGYSSEELLNKPALSFVPPDEQARTAAAIERVFTAGYAELEGHLLTKERRLIPYHWTGALLKNRDGEPIGITGIARDVSEQKRAEEALRRSEERFALAVEGSNDIFWDAHRLPAEPWYAPQTPIWWSPRVRQLLGLQESDLFETFEQWATRLHPDDKDRVFGQLTAHIERRVPYNVEYRLRTNRGDYRWIRGRGQALWDEEGEPCRMSGSCQDITEHKQMEEERQKQEVLITLMLSTGPACIKRVSADGVLLHMNPAGLKLVEACGEPEVVGRSVFDLVIPEHRDAFISMHRSVIEGHARTLQFEIQGLKGTRRWTESYAVPFRNPVTGQTEQLAVTHDITERKQVEETLRLSEERFRAVFENAAVGIAVGSHTTGTGIDQVNPVFASMLGYTPEELCHLGMKGLTFPDDISASKELLKQLVEGTRSHGTIEKRYVKKDGSLMWAQTTVSNIFDSHGRYLSSIALIQDITERKRVDEALRASEERYRDLYNETPTMYFTLAVDGTVCSVNRFGAGQLGYQVDELVGQSVLGLFHQDDKETVVAVLSECFANPEETRHWAFRKVRKDGSIVWVRETARVGQSSSGETVAFVTCEDITERKQVEAALQVSQEKLRQALQASNTGLWEWNTDTSEVLLSREWKRQIGHEEADLANAFSTWETHLHPDDHDRAIAFVQAYLANPLGEYQQEFRLRHKDETYRWIEARASFVTEPDGRRVRLLGSHTDITDRKRVEQEQVRLIEDLTRSQQHFQSLFNLTPSAVGISTVAEGRFIDVNEGFSRLTGYMREEVMGRTTLELGLWADVSERESVLREIQEQGYLHNQEGLLRTKSGEIRSLMVSVESIQLGSTPCLIYLCHDITERKRMEDALRARERELQSALQERERISQDLHDGILQSLFGVGLNLEVTKSLMPQKTRKTAGGSLDKSIDQLNRVMREIRNFIAGLDSELFEGKDLPAALKHLLESLTENQPTRVRFAVEDRAAKALSAEQSLHLFRVIQEAVSNCIRHGHAQEARVSLKLLKQGVRLRIRDDGRGFSQDTVKTGGYGLRNMAARAKKIGGRFTILSKENEGTRIILDLPKEVPHFSR
ncbi:MAG: PAS domain S-box protein [Nitrospira sp.]|nr:MAG: PAS domain S-box protein [Nitrospira sp.]